MGKNRARSNAHELAETPTLRHLTVCHGADLVTRQDVNHRPRRNAAGHLTGRTPDSDVMVLGAARPPVGPCRRTTNVANSSAQAQDSPDVPCPPTALVRSCPKGSPASRHRAAGARGTGRCRAVAVPLWSGHEIRNGRRSSRDSWSPTTHHPSGFSRWRASLNDDAWRDPWARWPSQSRAVARRPTRARDDQPDAVRPHRVRTVPVVPRRGD